VFELIETKTYRDWRLKLRDVRASVIIASRLSRLAAGFFGDARSVGGDIKELRIHLGPGYRVYFQQRGNRLIVLLCAGDKDSQANDIARAKQLASSLEDP
jgi:putative addiction module killer protein